MCTFCDIINKVSPAIVISESADVVAFLDNDPINNGHVLILPKTHYTDIDEIPVNILHEIIDTAKQLSTALKKMYSPDGYTIMQNGGQFCENGHFHLHIFPRYKEDGFAWTYPTTPR